ncbi:MAG: ATP-binding cassette domain-containing protein [Streptosporangiales bacterium]|nr:ATP-binding cassette domain-containing protein [Streptosporangiales bacterium]
MLRIEAVSKTFEARRGRKRQQTAALHDVDLEIQEQEFCAIIGPSGCGKSTLLRIIDGLIAPTSGTVKLHGEPVTAPGRDRGMVFQHAHLLPWRTVQKNVEYGLECLKVPAQERRRRASEYVELVGLQGFENHYPSQLSGGMQQRVSLARVFVVEPQMLLLDEPFGALDAQTRLSLQTELERMWTADKKTTLLITHDMEEALFLADRVVVMSARPGRISHAVDVPFDRPRTDAVRAEPEFARMKLDLWDALKKGMNE